MGDVNTSGDHGTRGQLLVAGPQLSDPNFHRTVIAMVEHTSEGALGIVLNRPTEVPVASVSPDWAAVSAEPDMIFHGGPVEPQGVLAVGRYADPNDAPQTVVGPFGLVDLDDHGSVGSVSDVRLYAGYAGWGPGQLDMELAEDAWVVLAAEAADLVSPAPEELWYQVFARQRGPLRALAFYPDDPRAN